MLDRHHQVDRARNQRRKSAAKSPINIRDKIKELETQIEKHHKNKQTQKRIPHLQPHKNFNPHPSPSPVSRGHRDSRSNRNRALFKSQDKRQQLRIKKHRSPLGQQSPQLQQINQKNTPESTRRLYSPQPMTKKQSESQKPKQFQQKLQGQQYQTLLKQNQRYRDIYSQSIEKLQKLQGKLYSMKSEHQSERNQLQTVVQQLKCKVDQKTNNLAHIYSFEVRNDKFLVVKDKIITQTDNQNSSSHLQVRRQYLVSDLASFVSNDSK